MFQELMPLLSQRVLIVTLSRVTDEQICVNVIPKSLKSDQQSDDSALTTPLAVTGTPKELDEQLPKQLVEFVEIHLGLSSTLKSAKEQIEAAAKSAREAARRSTTSKSNSASATSATQGPTQQAEEESTASHVYPEANEAVGTSGVATTADIGTASTGNLFDAEIKNGD